MRVVLPPRIPRLCIPRHLQILTDLFLQPLPLRPVHTRELAPEKDSGNRFAPGACSLISNQFGMREQNSGAKVLLRNIFFSLEIVGADETALLWKRVTGACCGSKLPLLYRPRWSRPSQQSRGCDASARRTLIASHAFEGSISLQGSAVPVIGHVTGTDQILIFVLKVY